MNLLLDDRGRIHCLSVNGLHHDRLGISLHGEHRGRMDGYDLLHDHLLPHNLTLHDNTLADGHMAAERLGRRGEARCRD